MSDASVAVALRSAAPLVVIEAPAGCGKTHQGAAYARDIARATTSRLLIITHTHAACGVFAERTAGLGRHVEIRTIDSVIAQIGAAYHGGLGLPADIATWTRRTKDGHKILAARVAQLLARYPIVASALAVRYPTIICDEHQDSSADQHAIVMALLHQGAKVRIFGDPMQHIYKDDASVGASPPCDWGTLVGQADSYADLDTPHRWTDGCAALGNWTLSARATLKAGGRIDLTRDLPASVSVAFAENVAQHPQGYQLNDAKSVYGAEKKSDSLLILARHNHVVRACRGMFGRRLPMWEGHTRRALEVLVDAVRDANNQPARIAAAVVTFIGAIGKGFSPSAFGNRFEQEARELCAKSARGKSAKIQELAKYIVEQPDHRGVAVMLRRLAELRASDSGFSDIAIDHHSEYWDAIRLGGFDDLEVGLAEITNRRTYSRPRPPAKAISTIHKAKGLECGGVIILGGDVKSFPEKPDARCLLYVALSRAKDRLHIVASQSTPSPLLIV